MSQATPAPAPRPRRLWLLLGLLAVVAAVVVAVLLSRGTVAAVPPAPTGSASSSSPAPGGPTASATSRPASPSPSATRSSSPTSPAPGGRPTAAPVPITATATPVRGVTAHVARIEAVTGKAELPGEVGGPALRVTVQVDNGTRKAVDLRGLVVNLYVGRDAAPAVELSTGERAMPDSVAPGKSASGVWVFTVPADERDLVAVEVDLATDVPVVVFRGEAPPAG
ncbi:hypothetical protein [Cellulomonas massiliensis]|uniref:hypothetical protein n=1 Tax=Cellulomonas massiliensis TaxID=1465811 RepID=UPI000365A841|nr:hypothetical protein [Cellulomonas massiliensis]